MQAWLLHLVCDCLSRSRVLKRLTCSRHLSAKSDSDCAWPLQNLLYRNCDTTNGRTATPAGKGHYYTLGFDNYMCQIVKSCCEDTFVLTWFRSNLSKNLFFFNTTLCNRNYFEGEIFLLCCLISVRGLTQWWPAVPMAPASDSEGGVVPRQVVQPPSL